ncbi:hypothetical protein SASPL_113880 [Salvia splendens]|uniref:Uncharacterized protein n=1 Tax=Salvia splendens TaxID=180675 RepID=A0A8X8Y2C8_SALSN|nr:hypothetical protein SASPL_113880 [Salvia splendens]
MTADSSSSDAKVHIIYTERPECVEPEQYHIRTPASVLGSDHVASGFSAKLTPQQFSYLKELLDDELTGEQPGVDGSNRDGERGPGWIATSMNRYERCHRCSARCCTLLLLLAAAQSRETLLSVVVGYCPLVSLFAADVAAADSDSSPVSTTDARRCCVVAAVQSKFSKRSKGATVRRHCWIVAAELTLLRSIEPEPSRF